MNISTYKVVALTALLMLPISMAGLTYNQKITCALTAACIGGYTGYTWLRTPEKFTPTLTSINPVTLTPTDKCPPKPRDISDFMDCLPFTKHRGKQIQPTPITLSDSKKCIRNATPTIDLNAVPAGQTVTVFSPFCSTKTVKRKNKVFVTGTPGRGAYKASRYIANGVIPQQATCVTFDYRDTRTGFNLGQDIDQQSLKLVVDEVIHQKHPMVLFGACRGALNILNFISTQPTKYIADNIKAAILEAPPFSLKEVCKRLAQIRFPLYFAPGTTAPLLYDVYRSVLPAYKDRDDDILKNVANIPKELPILIIHLHNDNVVCGQNIKNLLKELIRTGHTHVHALILNDPTLAHTTMSTAPAYSRAIHAFLKQYELPYDEPLAHDGAHIQSSFLTPLANDACIDTLFNEQAVTANGWRTK
ncbi:MAG: alpha/beta hydrolase family protein [Candidatus Babeliales bacterium]